MGLQKRKEFNRRKLLAMLGRAGLAGAGIVFLGDCKGSGPTVPDNPKPNPKPVNMQFDIYNHTQGLLASFTESSIMSGTSYYLGVPNLTSKYGIRNVDPTRISLRNDNFGSSIAYSRQGSVSFKVPDKDTNFDIFLFNDGGAIYLYDWLDALGARWGNDGSNMYRRNFFTFYRKDYDGLTGEERVWGGELLPETGDYGVFDQLNNTLQPPWAPFRYASFNRNPNGTSGDSSYGFGNAYGYQYAGLAHSYLSVNPLLMATIPLQVAGGIAGLLETLVGWAPIGDDLTYIPIQKNGVLNQVGKDLATFIFVRDPTARNRA